MFMRKNTTYEIQIACPNKIEFQITKACLNCLQPLLAPYTLRLSPCLGKDKSRDVLTFDFHDHIAY